MNVSENLAIAFDIGTTTIAAALLDRETGELLATAGTLNPQREFGLDVVSRLHAALDSDDASRKMKEQVNGSLRQLAEELLDAAGVRPESLRFAAIAGNPAMEHLLLGLPIRTLAFPPYRPIFTVGKLISAAGLDWDSTSDVYIFPLPGGFVGGDLVAFLYGQGVDSARCATQPVQLYLDLGTNGEIALATEGKIYATSAAAGPAFEGGNLTCGMAALPGAISGFHLEGEKVALSTIGSAPPAGICGSGVIETVAELLRTGIIDSSGRLIEPSEIGTNLANRIIGKGDEIAFLLYRDADRRIYLGQRDIRQLRVLSAVIAQQRGLVRIG